MEAAWSTPCTCSKPQEFERALMWSVSWRDKHEPLCRNAKSTIGEFAECLFFDSFKDRKENIFAVGVKGSGKTTVLNAFINILPDRRVFCPSYDSHAPFSGLNERHIVGNFQEFRCLPTMNNSTLLLWTERKPNLKVDVKHEDPTILPKGGPRCLFSCNYLSPCPGWKQEDIDTLYDRANAIFWRKELPADRRTQAARSTCQECSVTFLAKCGAKLKDALSKATGIDGKADIDEAPKERMTHDMDDPFAFGPFGDFDEERNCQKWIP